MTPISLAGRARRIALIAHDNRKQDMLEWAGYNRAILENHDLVATATTGRLLADEPPATCPTRACGFWSANSTMSNASFPVLAVTEAPPL